MAAVKEKRSSYQARQEPQNGQNTPKGMQGGEKRTLIRASLCS